MPCGCVWWDVTRAPFACRYPSLVKQLLDIQVGKNKEKIKVNLCEGIIDLFHSNPRLSPFSARFAP
jgi:hypothetical protein